MNNPFGRGRRKTGRTWHSIRFIIACIAGFICISAFAEPSDTDLEEVLVTGEHPGPGLWKVTNGENTLWILGTYEPLPSLLLWRSGEVELVMTEAQQVIGNYSATFTFEEGNPFAIRGKPLKNLLPRKSYTQWKALRKKYLYDHKELENALPVTAALALRSSAFQQNGLASANSTWREIQRLAHAYHVPITTEHQVNRPVHGFAANDANSQRVGVEFLINTMNSLEGDLRNARARANAWATGDIEALRKQADADKAAADLYASSWPYFKPDELRDLSRETDARWIAAADKALRNNRTTFAGLPIFLLLRPDGLLGALRARGFEVEEPAGDMADLDGQPSR